MSLDCGTHIVLHAAESQLVLPVAMLGRERHFIPGFAFKNDIVITLCTTQVQVQPKYMNILNDAECILEFEEGMQMVDVRRSLE